MTKQNIQMNLKLSIILLSEGHNFSLHTHIKKLRIYILTVCDTTITSEDVSGRDWSENTVGYMEGEDTNDRDQRA